MEGAHRLFAVDVGTTRVYDNGSTGRVPFTRDVIEQLRDHLNGRRST